jgi:uncharacterized protein
MASSSETTTRPTVVIVGAGAAGIFTAYQIATQYPGTFDVRIFEAAPAIGGNVSSVTVEYGGRTYVIDAGAQFYYPNPQPHYVQLVSALGLTSTSYPAGFTVWESSTGQRLLWVPSSIGRFARYTARDWEAFLHFCGFVVAATWLNVKRPENWTLSVSDWLAGIPEWLMPASFAPVIEAFLYQFVSLPMGQIGQSSALYATTYFVRNIFGTLPAVAVDDTPTFSTYQNDGGLLSVLQAALTASAVPVPTRSPVTAVAPGRGTVAVTVGGATIDARYVVLACNPNTSARLLAAGGTASQDLVQLLQQFPYLELPVVLQQNGSCWMPSDPTYWEPVNTVVNTPDQTISFNAWLGALRPAYGSGRQIPVFKSWGAPGLDPASCSSAFHSHTHDVLLPTTTFMQLRRQLLSAYQGQNGLFFAGGWTTWFDSQEAALLSAMDIVGTLSSPAAASAPLEPAVAFDCAALPFRVKAWLEMVLSRKTERHKNKLVELLARLP